MGKSRLRLNSTGTVDRECELCANVNSNKFPLFRTKFSEIFQVY